MQFVILFLTIFHISMSQATSTREMARMDFAHPAFGAVDGRTLLEESIWPRHKYYTKKGSGGLYTDPYADGKNEDGFAYIYHLITNLPSEFDSKFPSSTVGEINDSLAVLKAWTKKLKSTLNRENVWGFDFFPVHEALELSKGKRRRQIFVFENKINELREKRKALSPPSKPSIMTQCLSLFQTS